MAELAFFFAGGLAHLVAVVACDLKPAELPVAC